MYPDVCACPEKIAAHAERNRQRVVSAARDAFAELGLEAPMDEIARRAGVGVGTLYRRYPTRADLITAAFEAKMNAYAEAARQALADPDPWAGFCGFMTYSTRVMAEDRALSEAMDQRPVNCGRAAERAGLPDLIGAVVERAQADGRLRDDITAADVPSLICGLGRAVRADGDAPSMTWERHLEIILAGLRA